MKGFLFSWGFISTKIAISQSVSVFDVPPSSLLLYGVKPLPHFSPGENKSLYFCPKRAKIIMDVVTSETAHSLSVSLIAGT